MGSESLALLQSTSLFSCCKSRDLEEIASLSEFLSFDDGSTIFKAGNPSDCLYIVRDGEIVIRKDDDEGRAVDIARFVPGDCFGELDMFTGTPRNAAAYAVGTAGLLTFPSGEQDFRELSQISPVTSARLLHSFLVQVSSRIRGVNSLVKDNSRVVRDLKRQVYVDKLTGLYNRTYFDETLEKMFGPGKQPVGLLLYKPDNFKIINDSHGHDAGDKVLRLIADKLRSFVPEGELLFRFMGNENAVIISDVTRSDLASLAERIGDMLRSLNLKPLLDDNTISLSVSFGLALSPDHGNSAAELVDAAHPLTLEGRRRGGNLVLFPEDSREDKPL